MQIQTINVQKCLIYPHVFYYKSDLSFVLLYQYYSILSCVLCGIGRIWQMSIVCMSVFCQRQYKVIEFNLKIMNFDCIKIFIIN